MPSTIPLSFSAVYPYGGGPRIIVDVAVTGVNGHARRSDLDADQPLHHRFNQKKAKYAQAVQDHGLSFVPAIFSHTGQVHQAIFDLMYSQTKLRLNLTDPQMQGNKIQETLRFWLMQSSCVIDRTASRSILASQF